MLTRVLIMTKCRNYSHVMIFKVDTRHLALYMCFTRSYVCFCFTAIFTIYINISHVRLMCYQIPATYLLRSGNGSKICCLLAMHTDAQPMHGHFFRPTERSQKINVTTSNAGLKRLVTLFLPREAMLSAVFAVVVCLCVCHTPVLYQNGYT